VQVLDHIETAVGDQREQHLEARALVGGFVAAVVEDDVDSAHL
jgi:hypothetical protein